MPKLRRIIAILLLLPLIILGCGSNLTGNGPNLSKPSSCPPLSSSCDVTPSPSLCTPKYVYDNLANEGQSWVVVNQQQDQNNSASSAQVTFTSTTSKTITVTDEQDLTLTLGVPLEEVITVSVEAHINHKVSRSVITTIGNSYNFSVPPGETAYGNYGVKVQITNGHLYDKVGCEGHASDWGEDITYVPIADGWCVWTNNEPPCPSI